MEGCRVTLKLDKDIYEVGDPIDLHISLENISRQDLGFGSGGPFPYRIEVILPGVAMRLPRFGINSKLIPREHMPGKTA